MGADAASLLPAAPWARRALSLWFVFHLVMVVNYVWLDEGQKKWLRPLSKPYVEALQLTQKWNMFRNPARWDRFLEAEGVAADGTVTALPISREPPAEPFLRLRYDRTVKIHNIIAYEDADGARYRDGYARWLCREGGFAAVRLHLVEVKHWEMGDFDADGPPPRERRRRPLTEVTCR